jgi:hypothetical protein
VSAASVCEREHLSESVRVLRQHCILRWAMNKVVCKFMEVFQCFCWTEQNVELAKLVNLLALHAFFFFLCQKLVNVLHALKVCLLSKVFRRFVYMCRIDMKNGRNAIEFDASSKLTTLATSPRMHQCFSIHM